MIVQKNVEDALERRPSGGAGLDDPKSARYSWTFSSEQKNDIIRREELGHYRPFTGRGAGQGFERKSSCALQL